MPATGLLFLFKTWHVAGKGRFYAWPDALVHLKKKDFFMSLFQVGFIYTHSTLPSHILAQKNRHLQKMPIFKIPIYSLASYLNTNTLVILLTRYQLIRNI